MGQHWPTLPAVLSRVILPPTLHQKFSEALEAYSEAIELDSTNMSFVSNRAAVFFEQKEYETCIAEVSGFLQDSCSPDNRQCSKVNEYRVEHGRIFPNDKLATTSVNSVRRMTKKVLSS